ncbi:MAG TPA: S4 domain-containing protein, partial [Pseudomonas sp.]
MRLDRFLSKHPEFNRQDVRHLLLAGRVRVDGQVVGDGRCEVNDFKRIELDAQVLQPGYPARYL